MSRPEISIEPAAGIRRARALLVVFVVLWVALAAWVLRYGQLLSDETATGASETTAPRVAASDTLPLAAERGVENRGSGESVVEENAGGRSDERSAATVPVESAFEARRREELATLARLLETVRFERLGSEPAASVRESLERAFEILFLYPDTRLELVVRGRETNDAAFDRRLARERGERIVDYLVSRGIERGRLAAGTGDGRGLPFGEHRVRVKVDDADR